jgi:hypothetical protein
VRRFEPVPRARRAACALAFALSTISVAVSARGEEPAEPSSFPELRRWSGPSALTLPQGRVELGLLSTSRYGVSDRLELGVHPLWFFALPHVEAKYRYWERSRLALAARGRLSYPSIFLGLVSREGSGGLLPKTSEPPVALMLEADAVVTGEIHGGASASLSLGLAVAPHTSFTEEELPLLDFPFLYPRFAPLYSPLVPRAQLNLESALFLGFHVDLEFRGYFMPSLPYVGSALAMEQALTIEYRFGERAAVSLGGRIGEAQYPVGQRVHVLPFVDVRVGL